MTRLLPHPMRLWPANAGGAHTAAILLLAATEAGAGLAA